MSKFCCHFRSHCSELDALWNLYIDTMAKLKDAQEKNERESKEYRSLFSLIEAGKQIVGIDRAKNGETLVVFCEKLGSSRSQDFYLVRLPFQENCHWHNQVGVLYLQYVAGGGAEIVDWNVNVRNCGYGSIFMKHILNFLQAAGYYYVYGAISPVDSDHQDLLLHFYGKFGFLITDARGGWKHIYLDLCRAGRATDFYMLECMARVKAIAGRKNISSEEIAQRLRIPQQLYANYEEGKVPLSITYLKKLCEILDVTSDCIIGVSEDGG